MARLSDLKPKYRVFMQTYRYRSVDFGGGARLSRPIEQARVALVTTAGFHLPDQEPFDESVRGGDDSFRIIPADADVSQLRSSHRSDAFDHAGIEADPNVALPLERLRELAAEGRIGGVAPRHLSFMGSITAPARLIRQTAPQAAELLRADGVEAVVLTPV